MSFWALGHIKNPDDDVDDETKRNKADKVSKLTRTFRSSMTTVQPRWVLGHLTVKL